MFYSSIIPKKGVPLAIKSLGTVCIIHMNLGYGYAYISVISSKNMGPVDSPDFFLCLIPEGTCAIGKHCFQRMLTIQ